MLHEQIRSKVLSLFPYEPTSAQMRSINLMIDFMIDTRRDKAFLLRGYAGTGKSSLVGAFVRALPSLGWKTVLLAPTGRAAKVLSSYSGKKASTIHKKIYRIVVNEEGARKISLSNNKHTNTFFFVDEASMIGESQQGDNPHFGNRSLLDDVLSYIYAGDHCYAILIGDRAQLPPVGADECPALDAFYLERQFSIYFYEAELEDVVRQEEGSGILHNASILREVISGERPYTLPLYRVSTYHDIYSISGLDLGDLLSEEYSRCGVEEVILISRSNKRCVKFNREVRARIRFLENDLCTGDYLMVVRNNYYWLDEQSEMGYIANGEIAQVTRIQKVESLYGSRFAWVSLDFADYESQPPLECCIILDTLYSEAAALCYEDHKHLFHEISKEYEEIPSRKEQYKRVKENPYFNALQVKFSYALTAHKTQGGQWKSVFIDAAWYGDEVGSVAYLKWMYTAITRATERVYLINFKEEMVDQLRNF